MKTLAAILLFAGSAFALPRFPTVEIWYQPGDVAAPFERVREELKIWGRHARTIFGVRVRMNVKYSPIADKCPGVFEPFQEEMHFWCLWKAMNRTKVQTENNGKIVHVLTQPLMSGDLQFWLGGRAFVSCFKNLHPNGSAGGFGVSNFVLAQRDGISRLTKSEAAFLHEIGHHTFRMSHDGAEEDYLMNTAFNVLGLSEKTPPELWRLSPQSQKEMRKCMNFRSRK